MCIPGPSGVSTRNTVVIRNPSEMNPTISIDEPFVEDTLEDDLSYEKQENSDENEIVFEGLVNVASPKSNIAPENAKILGTASLKRPSRDTDTQVIPAKRPLRDITNVPAIYKDEILNDMILQSNLFSDFFTNQSKLIHDQQTIIAREQELRRKDQEMMANLINSLCKTNDLLLKGYKEN